MSRVLAVNPHTPHEAVLAEAASVVTSGGIIVYPTETLYGIGADARNRAAIQKVAQAKRRKSSQPILIIVHSADQLRQFVANVPLTAEQLMHAYWPGPLTLVFEAAGGIPEELTQGSGTIGVRIPASTFCLELLRRCDCALTSTSANITGEPVRRTITEIRIALGDAVDLYIDAGKLPDSKPSTVVSVVTEKPKLIREGTVSFDELRKIVPTIEQ